MFNPDYTFDTFVRHDCNDFACDVARVVAGTPGRAYNPLLLYGELGTGKTHLLHAIGQDLAGREKNARIACFAMSQFIDEYLAAVRQARIPAFREKLHQYDLLLLDGAELLVGKERLQEEMFHTFVQLVADGRQIVLACDCPANRPRPAGLMPLEQRLVSRFEWGQTAELVSESLSE